MIVIAHRLTTIQHCDRIYRLKQVRIIEEGTPEQVLNKPANLGPHASKLGHAYHRRKEKDEPKAQGTFDELTQVNQRFRAMAANH